LCQKAARRYGSAAAFLRAEFVSCFLRFAKKFVKGRRFGILFCRGGGYDIEDRGAAETAREAGEKAFRRAKGSAFFGERPNPFYRKGEKQ
jgi:hypothetical protein